MGVGDVNSVSESKALSVPAIDAAVHLISSTISALPVHLYQKSEDGGRDRVHEGDKYARLINHCVNLGFLTAPQWLKWLTSRLLLEGRALTWVEYRGGQINLWPLKLDDYKCEIFNNIPQYTRLSDGTIFYADEILDFIYKQGSEPHSHYNPVKLHAKSITHWHHIETYGSALFGNGGVSPVIASITAGSPEAFEKAREMLGRRLAQDRADKLPISTIPAGVEIKTLGHDPQKQQLLESKMYLTVEFARAFGNLHPALIQDHTKSTYSNTEQAAINFATTVIAPITHLIESEMNIKMFNKPGSGRYFEFNLDGLQRGDIATRFEAYSKAIQNSILSPDEVRSLENRPAVGGSASKLLVQGATVPLDSQPTGRNGE